jgi:hypothetical protein
LGAIRPGNRVGILTDEFSYSGEGSRSDVSQRLAVACLSASGGEPSDLARLLRKQSSDGARQNGSKPKHTEGATMIAATAFAVVGLVVVAFLNRIP